MPKTLSESLYSSLTFIPRYLGVHPEAVDFGSEQGLSVFATAPEGIGIYDRHSALFRGLQKSENAALGRKMPLLDGHALFFYRHGHDEALGCAQARAGLGDDCKYEIIRPVIIKVRNSKVANESGNIMGFPLLIEANVVPEQ